LRMFDFACVVHRVIITFRREESTPRGVLFSLSLSMAGRSIYE
jgi:hypothetical protein